MIVENGQKFGQKGIPLVTNVRGTIDTLPVGRHQIKSEGLNINTVDRTRLDDGRFFTLFWDIDRYMKEFMRAEVTEGYATIIYELSIFGNTDI